MTLYTSKSCCHPMDTVSLNDIPFSYTLWESPSVYRPKDAAVFEEKPSATRTRRSIFTQPSLLLSVRWEISSYGPRPCDVQVCVKCCCVCTVDTRSLLLFCFVVSLHEAVVCTGRVQQCSWLSGWRSLLVVFGSNSNKK